MRIALTHQGVRYRAHTTAAHALTHTHTLAVDVKNEILSEHKKVHVLEQHRADSAWLSACFVRAGIDKKKLIMRSGDKKIIFTRAALSQQPEER
jgi:hypothetical protein